MAAHHNIQEKRDDAFVRVLIVESRPELGMLWHRHLERQGMQVTTVTSQDAAVRVLETKVIEVIILDLVLEDGCALAVSDYANFRHPDTQVIFVTNTTFFSDGSIFRHAANARAFLPSSTPPDDLAAVIEHCGSKRR